jgi:hypothetical protein
MPEITEGTFEVIPKGTYVVQYHGFNAPDQEPGAPEIKALPLGNAWEWKFEVKSVVFAADPNDDLDEDDEPVKSPEDYVGTFVRDTTSLYLSPKAKATKWIMGLLGMRELPTGPDGKIYFDFEWGDVNMRYAVATIGHKDNGWPKILELAPYKPKGKKQAVVEDDEFEPALAGADSRRSSAKGADLPF